MDQRQRACRVYILYTSFAKKNGTYGFVFYVHNSLLSKLHCLKIGKVKGGRFLQRRLFTRRHFLRITMKFMFRVLSLPPLHNIMPVYQA